jgi:hypothetical protein
VTPAHEPRRRRSRQLAQQRGQPYVAPAAVALAAGVAGRAAAEVEAPVGADGDRVLLVAAEGEAAHDRAPRRHALPSHDEPVHRPLRGDIERRSRQGEAERRAEASREHARLRRAATDCDHLAALLGRVEEPAGAERERGRTLQTRRVELGRIAARQLER